jgi:DNA-binding response OmpR family regulator
VSTRRYQKRHSGYGIVLLGREAAVPQTVLIVDDHAPTVELIRDALVPHGYDVLAAGNGAECLMAVEHEIPDLVILDVQMPVLNGLDTLRLLRHRLEDEDLPVIVLSGRGNFSDVRRAWQRGADIYLTKPVRIGAVVAAVKWLLRGGAEVRAGDGTGEVLGSIVRSDF